jgi:hypothetical protein
MAFGDYAPMPIFNIYCQSCRRDDDAVEFWQCESWRLVMCRNCWERHTQAKNPIDPDKGFFHTMGHMIVHSVAWDCPLDGDKTRQYKVFPLQMPPIR